MSAEKTPKPPMKKSEKKFIVIAAVVFVGLMAALLFATPKAPAPEQSAQETGASEMPVVEDTAMSAEPTPAPATPEQTITEEPVAPVTETPAVETTEAAVTEETPAATETAETPTAPAIAAAPVNIDVNAALSDRVLGDTSAPIKISEHASFTCSHCAEFHVKTFDELKKNYIDTKKAYLVFSDFPLNEPALKASMVARCLPEDKYFDFVGMLFKTQGEWAYRADYIDYLKEKAGENGLGEEAFKKCVENDELKAGIENRMKGVAGQWNISSTPSFVINNRTTLSGSYPYESFVKVLKEEDDRLKGIEPGKTGDAAKKEEPAAEETPAAEDGGEDAAE